MRTTLTLDDDVARALEAIRRREGTSLKSTVNRLLRAGLRSTEQPTARPYRTATRSLGLRAGFDEAKLNQLVDELEVESSRARADRSRLDPDRS